MKIRTLALYALLNTVPLIGYSQTFNHTYELYVEPLGSRSPIGSASISQNNDSLSARVFVPQENIDLLLTYDLATMQYSSYSSDTVHFQNDQKSFNIFTAYSSYLNSLNRGTLNKVEFDLKINQKVRRVKLEYISSEGNVHTYKLQPDEDGLEIAEGKSIEYLIINCSPNRGIFHLEAMRKSSPKVLDLIFNFKRFRNDIKDGLNIHGSLEDSTSIVDNLETK
ncbi:MAG: hypothetical protein V1663_02080 [archaeon]